MIGRVLYHAAGLAFLTWVVLVPLKWAFLAGLALFGLYAWDTRPGSEERRLRTEAARPERAITPEERVREEVERAATVTPRLVGRGWLDAAVRATNPTGAVVELEAVSCRVLLAPDVGPSTVEAPGRLPDAQPLDMAGVANPPVELHREHPFAFPCSSRTSPRKAASRYTLVPPRPDNPAASVGQFLTAALTHRSRPGGAVARAACPRPGRP